jgi:FrmR/RcnR family transcriptional regulator, repressor of frmRAB operon
MGSRANSLADAEKEKLLKRLSRMRGQIEAMHRAVDSGAPTTSILQQATACRGALDGFIAEVIEDHVREHVVDDGNPASVNEAAEELIGIVHSYLT